jgi:hypothetical protein
LLMRVYGKRIAMKTTVEVPDDLCRHAKAEAALRGRTLKDLIEEGLRLVLEAPRKTPARPSLAELPSISKASAAMPAFVDSGPLVAFFGGFERHHGRVAACIKGLEAPLLACEPVLAETMHLLARYPGTS